MALLTPHLILRVAPGCKQKEERVGSIKDELGCGFLWRKKGDLEQLLKGAIEDQEKQVQLERGDEGPDETDKEIDRLLRASKAAERGQLRKAAKLLRGSKLLPPTRKWSTMGVFEVVDEKECYDNGCKPLMLKWVD